jgi:hypothetical protein
VEAFSGKNGVERKDLDAAGGSNNCWGEL